MRGLGVIGFIVFLIFGLYLIVESLSLINLPSFLTNINQWIFVIAGILLIIGGFYFWKQRRLVY